MPSVSAKSQITELFQDPKKCCSAFARAIVQDAEKNKFENVNNKLLALNEKCDNSSNDATIAENIDDLVNQGIIETIWQVFVKMINQPVIQDMSKSLLILQETLCSIITISPTGKTKANIFLPYLIRNIIGNTENDCQLRVEAAKLINTLIESVDSLTSDQINDLKTQKTIRDDIGDLLKNTGDFELQALILEIVFRLLPPSERTAYISKWFDNKELRQLFLSIQDTSFEPGCRKFLNALNNSNPERRVYSIPCQTVFFGSQKVAMAKDTESDNYWVDFNIGSGTLKFFVEEKCEKEDDAWWHTVVITPDDVCSCVFLEPHHYGPTVKITLKDDVAKLIPSMLERGDRCIFIRLGKGSEYGQQILTKLFHQMNWIRSEFLSPTKSSVVINIVHVGSRRSGTMEIVPCAKPPEALMEGDEPDSDYPSSITGLSQESPSQITSVPSQEQNEESIKSKDTEKEKSKQDGDAIMANNEDESEGLPTDNNNNVSLSKTENLLPSKVQNTNAKTNSSDEQDNKAHDAPPRSRRRGRKNSDVDSGAESSSSRQSSGRTSRSRKAKSPLPKKTKSPLPVEIYKSLKHSKYSSSTTTDEDKQILETSHGGAKVKSAFDIAKEITKDAARTYPKAFNVDKRMQSKKTNAAALSHSQELSKKVFGQKGKSFSQKTTNDRRSQTNKLFSNISPSKKNNQSDINNNDSSQEDWDIQDERNTKQLRHNDDKVAAVQDETNNKSHHAEDVEVIQDSLPLDDSPEKVSKRRSEIVKVPDRTALEERLIKTAPAAKTTKKHTISFEHVSPRLGTMLRKGGPSTRGSLLKKEDTGWGTSTSTSTSESDWPGPYVEPGPKPRHSLVPHVSIREKRASRSRASQQPKSTKKKRASVSPGLSAITEEQTPPSIKQKDKQSPQSISERSPIDSNRNLRKRKELTDKDDENTDLEEENMNDISDESKARSKRKNRPEENEMIEDFQLDLPDVVIERSSKDKPEKPIDKDDTGAIEFVDEKTLEYVERNLNTTDKHNNKRKSLRRYDEVEHNKKSKRAEKVTNDEYDRSKEMIEKSKENKGPAKKRSKTYQPDDDDDDLYDAYRAPPKRTTFITTNKAQPYVEDSDIKKKTSVKKDSSGKTAKDIRKHISYGVEDDFDFLEDAGQDDKVTSNTVKMLAPPRALHHRKEIKEKAPSKRERGRKSDGRKGKTLVPEEKRTIEHHKPKHSTKKIQLEDDDVEDNEAAKLRQFCESIAGGRITSTPAAKLKELDEDESEKEDKKENGLDYNDSEYELSGYSEVDTEPTKSNYSKDETVAGLKRHVFGDKSLHEIPRLQPSITQVPTSERSAKRQPGSTSKWKTPKQTRLDDSGIGVTPPSTGSHRAVSSIKSGKENSNRGRRKGELLVTRSISKTPITPRTSAVMKRIDEEQVLEQNVDKSRLMSRKFVNWTSSGPSKEPQYDSQDDDEIEEVDHYSIRKEKYKPKSKSTHNPNIRPRQLFKEQHMSHRDFDIEPDDGGQYRSSDDSVIGDITNIMSELEGTLNDRLRRKRNHLQRFCKKTFDVTLQTVSKHLEQSFASRDQLVDSFNDQFVSEMNTLKEEMEKTKKNEEQIMTRIQEDIKTLKTARIIQEKKVRNLRNLCVEFQSELIRDDNSHPQNQGALQDDIRKELVSIQHDFMREAQSQDRENLRRSLRSVLDVTMM